MQQNVGYGYEYGNVTCHAVRLFTCVNQTDFELVGLLFGMFTLKLV